MNLTITPGYQVKNNSNIGNQNLSNATKKVSFGVKDYRYVYQCSGRIVQPFDAETLSLLKKVLTKYGDAYKVVVNSLVQKEARGLGAIAPNVTLKSSDTSIIFHPHEKLDDVYQLGPNILDKQISMEPSFKMLSIKQTSELNNKSNFDLNALAHEYLKAILDTRRNARIININQANALLQQTG